MCKYVCMLILWNILSVDFGRLWKGKYIEKKINIYIHIFISQISDKIMITTHIYIYVLVSQLFPTHTGLSLCMQSTSTFNAVWHAKSSQTCWHIIMYANDQQCLCIHINIYIYVCMCVCFAPPPKATSSQQCWHTSKHCQPATLARQQNQSN